MERRLRLNERCNYRLLIEKQTFDEVVETAPECRDFISYPAAYTFMQQWAALDLVDEWKKLSLPVLIVYGTSDFVSTIADNPYMADAINSFHPGTATLKSIPAMDHSMFKAESMERSMNWQDNQPREFETAVLDVIRKFLNDVTSFQKN